MNANLAATCMPQQLTENIWLEFYWAALWRVPMHKLAARLMLKE